MIEINHHPSRRELRLFAGLWFPAFWGLIGLLGFSKWGRLDVAVALWGAAVGISVIGLWRPRFMRWIYLGMVYAVYPIGFVISHVLLALIYYAVMTPFGLVMRLVGRDPMGRRIDRTTRSYWIPRRPVENVERYFRQY